MALTLSVDACTLPERGLVHLAFDQTFEIKISAEEARHQVKRWLLNEVSYMFTANVPILKVGQTVVWRVPVVFTASHIGHVGVVGEIEVDVETGAMNNTAANKEAFFLQARKLANLMPPYRPRTAAEATLPTDLQPTHPPRKPEGSPLDLLPVA
jgi:hypothetical protein